MLHTLRGHTKVVTGLVVSPRRALRLYSCSLDGTVIVWDISNGSITDRHDINQMPLLGISLPNEPADGSGVDSATAAVAAAESGSDLIYIVARTSSAGPETAVTQRSGHLPAGSGSSPGKPCACGRRNSNNNKTGRCELGSSGSGGGGGGGGGVRTFSNSHLPVVVFSPSF